ncbi:MAG: trypsin-like peptidase domain-containing protein [Chloroflexi bacterium]|nr:trypsin-like peptidase domain-containing protein [Chloroflexota bacterium]
MSRPILVGLSSLILLMALVVAACGGGSGGSSGTAVAPSPTAPAGPSPTALPAESREDGGGLYAPDVVSRLRPSVVRVLSEAATLDMFGQVTPTRGVGTGFIIDEEGRIITNNHVITTDGDQPAERITITLTDGRQFRARIVGRDTPTDLAVLQIDADNLTPVVLGSSDALQVGDDVLAIGNALDLPGGPTVTKGVVSAKGRLIQATGITIPDAIQTDASINPGNSGGPLVNRHGEVVGITTAVIRGEAEGIGLVISIDSARPVVEELIASGRVDRGFLGVSIVEISPSLAESFDLSVDHGVGVRDVESGGPADKAGLETGDIIVELAGKELTNSGELLQALTTYRAGDTVTVKFFRNGKLESVEITLG